MLIKISLVDVMSGLYIYWPRLNHLFFLLVYLLESGLANRFSGVGGVFLKVFGRVKELVLVRVWWAFRDSNPGPADYENVPPRPTCRSSCGL